MGYLDKDGLSRAFTKLKTLIDKKADVSHKHVKADISDFPAAMPASDVYSWAKASSKPSYSASEVGAVPTSRTVNGKALSANITLSAGDVGAAASSHSHNYAGSSSAGGNANWANGSTYAQYSYSDKPITTAGSGDAYTASVSGLTLVAGASFVMVPHTASTTTAPTLNVNGLGAKKIRLRLSSAPQATIALIKTNFLAANRPIRVTYDGTQWIIDDMTCPDVTSLYGTVPISKGGTGATTAAQALVNLGAMPKSKSMTTAEFNSLTSKDADTLYMITDDAEEQQVQNHLSDTTVHITSAERSNWNAKANIVVGTAEPSSSTSGNIYVRLNSVDTGVDAIYIKI